MQVRKAHNIDIAEIVNFQLSMALETEGIKLDRKTVNEGVQKIFNNPDLGTYWAVYDNKKIIACTLTIPEFSEWRNGTVMWIHSVFVIEEYREKGVFKMIYEYLKELVSNDMSLMGLRLYVDKTNIKAQKVYKKLGMDGEHYQLFEWMKN